jgi:hypothetical protein
MPAYSFKERFVPMVKDGTKRQTIRAFRRYPPRPGTPVHLYYGMRTKHCTKLVNPAPVMSKAFCIYINDAGNVCLIYAVYLDEDLRSSLLSSSNLYFYTILKRLGIGFKWLSRQERNQLSWDDGFRADETPTDACFDLMVRFWKQTHSLPFIGNIIYW